MKRVFLALSAAIFVTCSSDIDVFVPASTTIPQQGEPGLQGESAYEDWLKAIDNGDVSWSGGTDAAGFFRFLKGSDGVDGIDGIDGADGEEGMDGVDGRSAYDIWAESAAKGLNDPRDPTKQWDKTHTSMADFFQFMTGASGVNGIDGQSAYALWVTDVTDANGLDNPHQAGTKWPTDETGELDFWRYLQGADGADGEDGEDGQDGAGGPAGQSAYEMWASLVDNGLIEWNEGTDQTGFFRFLKGKDGEDGIDGVDGLDGIDGQDGEDGANGKDGLNGIDGESAYDLWKEAVAAGVDDPHNPGKEWNKDNTSMSDFYNFMSGRDGAAGISAYGLWVLDVRTGELENPHQPGTMWPTSQTTMMDFWHYLRGEDGEDGEDGVDGVVPPTPGQAGGEVTPVAGKANVIARYQNQSYSEYVNPEGGSVTFQVFNDAGAPAAGAQVSGMPGMSGSYTADANGEFTVPATDLPTKGTNEERFGVSTVTYTNSQGDLVTEKSAANTYVPQQVDVRLVIKDRISISYANANALGGAAYITANVQAERRMTSEGEWETIPQYLQTAKKYIYVFELSNPADPTSYTFNPSIRWNHLNIDPQEITTPYGKRIERPTRRWDAMSANFQSNGYHLWDGQPHHVNIVMQEFYGVQAHANASIQVPPVQFMPLPVDMKMSAYNSATDSFNHVEGNFDMSLVSNMYFFDANLASEDKGGYMLYTPVQRSTSLQSFTLLFKSGGSDVYNKTPTTTSSPDYSFDGMIKVGCDVYLIASGRFFVSPGDATPIGVLTEVSTGVYQIVPKNTNFEFAPIPVTVL